MTPRHLFRLLRLLRDWRTRTVLARRLRCSDREITRDLAESRRLGFHLEARVVTYRGQKEWRVVGMSATLARLTRG